MTTITTLAKGIINLEINNVTPAELVKLRNCFTQLMELHIHRFGPGKIIMNFNEDKKLVQIDTHRIAWKRKKVFPT